MADEDRCRQAGGLDGTGDGILESFEAVGGDAEIDELERDGYEVIRKAGRYMVFPRASFSEMMGWHGASDALVDRIVQGDLVWQGRTGAVGTRPWRNAICAIAW